MKNNVENDMTSSFDERISALLDDELTSFESRRVTGEVLSDPALKARWERYVLIGDVMRKEMPGAIDLDFASRVMAAIDDEPEVQLGRGSEAVKSAAWKRPLAGAAIAASVAALALTSMQMLSGTADPAASGMQVAASASPASVVSSNPASLSMSGSPTPALPAVAAIDPNSLAARARLPLQSLVQPVSTASIDSSAQDLGQAEPALYVNDRVNGYLTTHSEFASRSGMMSRIRVMGFPAQQPQQSQQ